LFVNLYLFDFKYDHIQIDSYCYIDRHWHLHHSNVRPTAIISIMGFLDNYSDQDQYPLHYCSSHYIPSTSFANSCCPDCSYCIDCHSLL